MSETGRAWEVTLGPTELEPIFDAAREGDLGPAHAARRKLGIGRLEMARALKSADERYRVVLLEYMKESRDSLRALEDGLRVVSSERHAQAMILLAEASNAIAEQSQNTAQSLKNWTIVLAGATVVLAVATIVLIFATWAA